MIYLDNCSTTKMRAEVLDFYVDSVKNSFSNPSSLHSLGVKSEEIIKNARIKISKIMKVKDSELFFTSGGTESNNIAIQGVVKKFLKRGGTIFTSPIEHSSVKLIIDSYNNTNIKVEKFKVDKNGFVDVADFESRVTEDTFLVSLMHVNNEIGTVEPIKEIGEIFKRKNPNGIFHVDGVQAFMKVPLNLKSAMVDLYSASSHKIYGPKGIGLLFVDSNLNINPIVLGGGQEKGLRSGTENLNGIDAFSFAVQKMDEYFEDEQVKIKEIKERYKKAFETEFEDIIVNTPKNSSPYILNISFKNIKGEVLLHSLEQDEIFISTSSACNSKGHGTSHVIEAISIPKDFRDGTIRICFSYENNLEEIDFVIDKFKKYISELRKIKKR